MVSKPRISDSDTPLFMVVVVGRSRNSRGVVQREAPATSKAQRPRGFP